MASLSAAAPEFVPFVYKSLPYTNYYDHSILFYPYHHQPSYHFYASSCLSSYPVVQPSQGSVSVYCNSERMYVGSPEWQLGPQVVSTPVPYDNEDAVVDKEVVSVKVVSSRVDGRKGVIKSRFSCGRRETNTCNREKTIWKAKLLKNQKLIDHKIRAETEPVQCDGSYTTVMIRNIPNKFTREMLLDLLDKHCMKENEKVLVAEKSGVMDENCISAYDFVYLPIDFGSKCNKGYAFVNFTNSSAVWKLFLSLHQQKWNVLNSKKICEINYARIQGKEALVKHFQKSMFACESDEFLPACFDPQRDGKVKSVVQTKVVGRRLASFPTITTAS